MVAFMVAAWYCYVRTEEDPRWGLATSACAWLAFFTKASAAFFVAAIALDATLTLLMAAAGTKHDRKDAARGAWWTLGGLALGGGLALAAFVVPHWADYRFYNWQMSVTRKPAYDIKSLKDRVTWFPLQDLFTRMWFALVVGVTFGLGMLARWRDLVAGERLLVLWIGLGATELVAHDASNERRFIFFIPALVALAAIALGRARLLPEGVDRVPRSRALLVMPLVLYASYVVAASIVRLAFLRQIGPNVRIAAVLAVAFTAVLYATWPRIPRLLARGGWTPAASLALAVLVSAGQIVQYHNGRLGGRTRITRRRSSSAGGCLRKRSSRENSRTACRSKTASGRSLSAAGSATTRTGRRVMMCDIF